MSASPTVASASFDFCVARCRVLAANVEREPHIVERRERREQVIGLEDEADVLAPDLGEFLGVGIRRSAWPPTRTVPLVGVSMQPRMESSVVLPLPDGPISSVSSPPVTARLTPLSACTRPAPSPRNFTASMASITGSVIA